MDSGEAPPYWRSSCRTPGLLYRLLSIDRAVDVIGNTSLEELFGLIGKDAVAMGAAKKVAAAEVQVGDDRTACSDWSIGSVQNLAGWPGTLGESRRKHKSSSGKSEILLAPSGKTMVDRVLVQSSRNQPMSDAEPSSELSKIARLNGDFRRNYGTLLGAFLYLRSISAARGRSWLWAGLASLLGSAAVGWLSRHGLPALW